MVEKINTSLPDSLTLRTQGQLEKLQGLFQHVSQSNRTAPIQFSQSNMTALSQTFQYAVRGTVGKGGFGYTILANMTTTTITPTSSSIAAAAAATATRRKKSSESRVDKRERMVVMKVTYCVTSLLTCLSLHHTTLLDSCSHGTFSSLVIQFCHLSIFVVFVVVVVVVVVLFSLQVDVGIASVVWEGYLHNELLPQRLSNLPVKSDRAQSNLPLLRMYERGPFLRPLSLFLFDDAAVLTMPYGELGTLIHVMSGDLPLPP